MLPGTRQPPPPWRAHKHSQASLAVPVDAARINAIARYDPAPRAPASTLATLLPQHCTNAMPSAPTGASTSTRPAAVHRTRRRRAQPAPQHTNFVAALGSHARARSACILNTAQPSAQPHYFGSCHAYCRTHASQSRRSAARSHHPCRLPPRP